MSNIEYVLEEEWKELQNRVPLDKPPDLISRQAAIDAIEREKTYSTAYRDGYAQTDYFKQYNMGLADGIKALKRLPSAQPEIIRCKDCKHFEYDHPYIIQGIPVLGHEVCNAWGDGCKTDENGWCFLAERRTDAEIH